MINLDAYLFVQYVQPTNYPLLLTGLLSTYYCLKYNSYKATINAADENLGCAYWIALRLVYLLQRFVQNDLMNE